MKMMRYLLGCLSAAVVLAFVSLVAPAHAQLSATQTWAGSAGGTANALTLNIHNVVSLNDLTGVPIRFLPSGINNGPATLTINLDSGGTLGPIAILRAAPSQNAVVQLSGGELSTNVLTEITYTPSTNFQIISPFDPTPIGTSIEIRGSTAPTGYLIEDGSCVSQTTYAPLFSVVGSNYNALAAVGCSAGQFAVPYSNGTVFLAQDNQGAHTANRVTSAGSNCNAVSIVLCGSQLQTLTLAQLPGIVSTSAGVTFSSSSGTGAINHQGLNVGAGSTDTYTPGGSGTTIPVSVSGTTAPITVNSLGTSGLPHPILNPALIGLRAIKY